MKQLAIIIALFATAISATAQKTYTLEELFSIAEQNARTIRISQDAFSAAKESVENAKAQRLPEIGVQLFLGYNGRGLITDRDFSNSMSVYIPEFANNFSLQVSQAIYAGGAISNTILLSETQERMAELDVEKNRQDVRFYIVGQYLDMMKTLRTIRVIKQNIALAEQLVEYMKVKVGQELALKNDITRYELQLENLKLQHRKLSDAYSIIKNSLCQTLRIEETEIRPDESLLNLIIDIETIDYWQRQTASASITLRQSELAKEMAEHQTRLAKSSRRPKISFIAEDRFNGPITIEIPPLNNNFNYWFVGFGIHYSLSALYKSRHDILRSQFELTKADERLSLTQEQENIAVHTAYISLLTANSELETCEKQVQLATENYSVVSTRYQNGLALITDLLDASNMKLSAEIAQEHARINILYHYKKLLYLCSSL